MKFPRDLLQEMTYEDKIVIEPGDWDFTESLVIESIENEPYDKGRWTVSYRQVLAVAYFTQPVRYFETYYSVGATEMQDTSPYENDGDEIILDEVFPVEVTTIEYKRKKNA